MKKYTWNNTLFPGQNLEEKKVIIWLQELFVCDRMYYDYIMKL